jgi:hypothetical protein
VSRRRVADIDLVSASPFIEWPSCAPDVDGNSINQVPGVEGAQGERDIETADICPKSRATREGW